MRETLHKWSARVSLFTVAVLTVAAVTAVTERPATAFQSKTVWDGIYTQQQAARGAASFASSCERCHTAAANAGEEGRNLAGKGFWDGFRESTVDHLLDYVSKNMPNGAGGSLSANTYVDLVAFILSRNDLPSGPTELTKESAVGVQIIAKNGPGELPNGTLVRVVGCLAGKEGNAWILNSATAPERPNPAADANDSDRPLGTRSIQLKFVITPMDRFVGHRLRVRGLLIGEGGRDGINVSQTESVAESCK
jgi:mono/diheme cytochrome c family protein